MRITNTMMTNSLLLRINKNMNNVNTYYTQMSSGKKIQMPSEDPIVASRALRLRNIVSSTEQYYSNSDQAVSWMETTESAFNNVTSILTTLSELSVQAASDQYKEDDRKKIMNQFNSLVGQLETELNSTYMGRYVFSGYKTDQPAVIKDELTGKNILNPKIYGTKTIDDDTVSGINSGTVTTVNNLTSEIATMNGNIASETDSSKKLALEAERDKLIEKLNSYLDITVSDDKTQISVNGSTLINGTTANNISAEKNATSDGVNILLNGSTIDSEMLLGDLREETIFSSVDGQEIELEVGVNNYITINSLAPNVYTEEMYENLHYFEKVYDYMSGTLSQKDTDIYFGGKSYSELSQTEAISFDKTIRSEFESMIAKIKDYSASITEQHTNLGVRMNRIELIQGRLSDDKVNYTSLMSKNEDINYADAAMNYNVANASYQAALKTGMTITQLTLADYL